MTTVDEIAAAVCAHVAAGGLALSKAGRRAPRAADADGASTGSDDAPMAVDRFTAEYAAAFLECRQRPYVDPAETERRDAYYGDLLKPSVPPAADGKPKDDDDDGTAELPPPPSYAALNAVQASRYRHAKRRVPLWAVIDREADGTLRCAYSGAVVETAQCCRLMSADEEHLVPQSWHRGSAAHPGTDMHQIFVVSKSANGTRGNYLFGFAGLPADLENARAEYDRKGAVMEEGGDPVGVDDAPAPPPPQPQPKLRGKAAADAKREALRVAEAQRAAAPDGDAPDAAPAAGRPRRAEPAVRSGAGGFVTVSRGPCCFGAPAGEGDAPANGGAPMKYFFPHRNIGAVCRATLYVLVTYRDTFHRAYFPPEQLRFLATTAAAEPVTPWERHRNQELARLQGTRNPFVDFPHWALGIDFSEAFQGFVGKRGAAGAPPVTKASFSRDDPESYDRRRSGR